MLIIKSFVEIICGKSFFDCSGIGICGGMVILIGIRIVIAISIAIAIVIAGGLAIAGISRYLTDQNYAKSLRFRGSFRQMACFAFLLKIKK